MSRPGDRPRFYRGIPKGPDPEEKARREEAARRRAQVERGLEQERGRQIALAERRRRGDALTAEEESLDAGHELRDMRTRQVIRWLGLLTIGVVVLIALVTVFEAGLLGGIGQLRPVVDEPPQVTLPPVPRLEAADDATLAELHEKESQILNNYTWIDQAGGRVSLPIERAIELTAQRGLPVRAVGDAPAQGSTTIPQGSSSGQTVETLP